MRAAQTLNTACKDYFVVRGVQGEYGFEIEVEGENLPPANDHNWKRVADNSLRGNSAEYVTFRPVAFDDVQKHLDDLKKMYAEYNTELYISPRTSVHVHRNVQKLKLYEVYNIIATYLLIENLMVRYSGKSRENNLFCLRASDAEMFAFDIARGLEMQTFFVGFNERNRYSALNLAALAKFGSLEFRSMRGDADFDTIFQWTKQIEHLYNTAGPAAHPRAILDELLEMGPKLFLAKYTTPHFYAWCIANVDDYEKQIEHNTAYVINMCMAFDWVNDLHKRKRKPEEMFFGKNVEQVVIDEANDVEFIDEAVNEIPFQEFREQVVVRNPMIEPGRVFWQPRNQIPVDPADDAFINAMLGQARNRM